MSRPADQWPIQSAPASTPTDDSTSTHPQGGEDAGATQGSTQGEAEATQPQKSVKRRPGRPFTSESAREARRSAAEQAAERKRQRDEAASIAHLTTRQRLGVGLAKVTQEDMDAVIVQLVAQAKAGDVKSIHALARLLDQSFGRAQAAVAPDGRAAREKEWDEMTEQERAEYRAALLEEHRRQQAAAGDSSDPRLSDPPTH